MTVPGTVMFRCTTSAHACSLTVVEFDASVIVGRRLSDDRGVLGTTAVVDVVAHVAVLVTVEIRVVSGDPAFRLTHQQRLVHGHDMVKPFLLGLGCGLEPSMTLLPHVFEQRCCPVDRGLDRSGKVRCGDLGSGENGQVGESRVRGAPCR